MEQIKQQLLRVRNTEPQAPALPEQPKCCGAWGQVIGEDERGTEYATPCVDCPYMRPTPTAEGAL